MPNEGRSNERPFFRWVQCIASTRIPGSLARVVDRLELTSFVVS